MNGTERVHPVAVFDSDLGGLTVLRALRDRLPQEDFFYFADTRFLPYGDRTEIFLKERGLLIAQALARRGAKALVIALILVVTYLLAEITDLFVVGAVFCALAFLLFFRCKKPLYYAITVSMAVLIWVVFHFVLNVSF